MSIFDIDKWQEIFTVLKKNKLRTFLTAFGVFWGIFMLVIMLGSGRGLENGVKQGMGDMATNSMFMWTQRTTIPYKGFPRGRHYNFKNDDVEAIRTGIPEIKNIAPRLQGGGFRGADNVVRGTETGAFNIFGDYPDIFKIDPVKILEGRFLNDLDINEKRKIAVIGDRVRDVLFKAGEKPIGEYIRIQGVYFKVVGVFRSKKSGQNVERESNSIFIPLTTLQQTYNYGNVIGWFAITSIDNVPVTELEEKVIALVKSRHNIAPEDTRAVGHFNVEKEFVKMNGLFNGINGLIWIVGIGTLLAGVIGVSNIMLIVVKERTKEIGIMRAIGATPANIISQIIIESVFLTTISGYFGLVIGVGLVELIDYFLVASGANTEMFLNPEVDFNIAISALVVLIFSGALAGLIPAKRAVSIKPVQALHDE